MGAGLLEGTRPSRCFIAMRVRRGFTTGQTRSIAGRGAARTEDIQARGVKGIGCCEKWLVWLRSKLGQFAGQEGGPCPRFTRQSFNDQENSDFQDWRVLIIQECLAPWGQGHLPDCELSQHVLLE